MLAGLHDLENAGEPLEVVTLRGSEWTFFEERHHDIDEIPPPLHGEAEENVSMVVVAAILDQRSTSEELPEELEGGA